MHQVVTPKQPVTNGQYIVECAGEEEEGDDTKEPHNDDPVISLHGSRKSR
jgi:hypothetical protein